MVTSSVDLVDIDSGVDSVGQQLGVSQVTQVLEHVDCCVKHSDRVGDVLSCNSRASVPCARLENSILQTKENG